MASKKVRVLFRGGCCETFPTEEAARRRVSDLDSDEYVLIVEDPLELIDERPQDDSSN